MSNASVLDVSARPVAEPEPLTPREHGRNLFLVGFLVLFLELACIRWFAAYVIFLQFFTNVVLIASFLGMSCGCLAARGQRDWLSRFPALAYGTVLAALVMLTAYTYWSGIAVDIGGQNSPQEVFFGTENRDPDIAKFVVPIDLIAAVFFVLISLMFVGLGQVLGRAFDAYPNRLHAYTLNIGGSLAGIAAFSVLAFLHAPPPVWFFVCCVGVGHLLRQHGTLTRAHVGLLLGFLGVVSIAELTSAYFGHVTRWSPYYAVALTPETGLIKVNTIGHQTMVPFDREGASYSLIHLLQRASGGKPFDDVLIIGAGSGNDMDHALHFGVKQIDAVEIDPVIQGIGIADNPDHPYQDKRVVPHLDDGRHFLRTTDRTYDLVVYALVDSLVLHSSYANLRLESYLFTEQAFRDIRRVLKPGGTFVTYNYFRQGWIIERVAAMAEKVFGCPPIVLSLPYRERVEASSQAGFTMIISGCGQPIAKAFAENKPFWLNSLPPLNLAVDGFSVRPETLPEAERDRWSRIGPTSLVHDSGTTLTASDDWPFLYLHSKLIPDITVRSMVVLGVIGLAMVYLFMPAGPIRLNNRMFFLGAAFMLLETKAVVQLALLFGSTWLVNSAVFFTVLLLILLANFTVLRLPAMRLAWAYAGLLLFLAASVLVPFDGFLDGGVLWRYAAPCLLALGPMYFAGVIFARSFRDTAYPDQAFGSNIAGSVLGGLCESFSMLLGFRYLLLLAILFYVASLWSPRGRGSVAG